MDSGYSSALAAVVNELNALKGLDIEIWDPHPVRAQDNAGLGYQLRRRCIDGPVLNIVLDTSIFEVCDGGVALKAVAKEEIVEAVEGFFRGPNPPSEQCVRIY